MRRHLRPALAPLSHATAIARLPLSPIGAKWSGSYRPGVSAQLKALAPVPGWPGQLLLVALLGGARPTRPSPRLVPARGGVSAARTAPAAALQLARRPRSQTSFGGRGRIGLPGRPERV